MAMFPVSKKDIQKASENVFKSAFFDKELDFVAIFPPELSEKLFTFLPVRDVLNSAQCSLSWRTVLNGNIFWQVICQRYGYIDKFENDDPLKWNKIVSHVDASTKYRFKLSPKFVNPPVASLRLEPLSDWALYYRQCTHLEISWASGFYIIHRLLAPGLDTGVCLSADCNESLVVLGSSNGKVFIWSSLGVPKLIMVIPPLRFRVEVQHLKLVSDYLIVFYQIGIIRIFQYGIDPINTTITLLPTTQIRVNEVATTEHEFTLSAYDISDEDLVTINPEEDIDLEQWIRELFRDEPWFVNGNFWSPDTILSVNKNFMILSGVSCNCFLIWDYKTGQLVNKVLLPAGYQLSWNFKLTDDKVYLSTRKLINNQVFNPSYGILIYELKDTSQIFEEISANASVEEIEVHPINNEKFVWITLDSKIFIRNGIENSVISRVAPSYIDTLKLHKHYILYHEYDGIIVCLNWDGDLLYRTQSHIGIVRDLRCHHDLLITGGDVKQLCVWDIHTGEKLYEIYHQPSRINALFVYETKIITLGTEDSPVLIGYW